MGPQIASLVREYDPNVTFLVSTWLLDDAERKMVYNLCDQNASWFDGLIMEVRRAGEHDISAKYQKLVFPEISMFGSLNEGYGCNGANPKPKEFAKDASEMAKSGYGAILYSEGIYEDINKIIWISKLWDPNRTAEDIVREYVEFYFGKDNVDLGCKLIKGLEQTWPPGNLINVPLSTLETLRNEAVTMHNTIPKQSWCLDRWHILKDRAEMDYLIAKIGSEDDILKTARSIICEAGYSTDNKALRKHLSDFQKKLEARTAGLDLLFTTHWNYLNRVHMQKSTILVIRPPSFIGERDWAFLLTIVKNASAKRSDEQMKQELLKGFKQWFWFNNFESGFMCM
jgi:hypothetical protein